MGVDITGQHQCGANINGLSGACKLLRFRQIKYPSTVYTSETGVTCCKFSGNGINNT